MSATAPVLVASMVARAPLTEARPVPRAAPRAMPEAEPARPGFAWRWRGCGPPGCCDHATKVAAIARMNAAIATRGEPEASGGHAPL